jgi:hypothetical protein
MTNFNKLTTKGGLTKDDDNANDKDVRAIVVVRGIQISLDEVSPSLRQQWHAASKKANRHASAQAELNAIGEAMLAERLPDLAIKYAVTHGVHGDHAVLKKLSE